MIKIKLREIMWDKDISAAEINRATGLNKANLSKISRNKHTNLSLNTINTLCNYLGCSLTDLVEYTPD